MYKFLSVPSSTMAYTLFIPLAILYSLLNRLLILALLFYYKYVNYTVNKCSISILKSSIILLLL